MPVDDHLYPVNLVLRGRRCLVVGGGTVAAHKVSGLVAAGAAVHVVAPWICDAIRALAADGDQTAVAPDPTTTDPTTTDPDPSTTGAGSTTSGAGRTTNVSFEEREYRPGDVDGAWLVVSATGSSAVNAAVRADAEVAHIWVNAADDPPSCSVTLPAVVRQGPVMVTVSTSGQSPALAAWMKGRLQDEIGPEFATLAYLLGQARAELQAAGHSTEDVDWRPALNSDMLDEIRSGDLARARKRLEACLSSSLD
jgi:precorrin-2 dehydrogenase / sirohydrochlorin ferrochelatase